MKGLKRAGAAVLAVALALMLALPVFAVETMGSITIDNAVKDQTYTIYRIFDLSDHNDDYSGVRYQVSEKWRAFFADGAAGQDYVSFDAQGYVSWKEGKTAADFAAAAIAFARSESIVHDGQQTATGNEVKFSNLQLGYYLVQSALGATCALDTTMPDVTIKEKNSDSTSEKTVQEDSDGSWGERNDADIGQTVYFDTTFQVRDGAPRNYVLHDKMTAGLAFDAQSLTVQIGSKTLSPQSDYTLATENLSDGCTFEVRFADNVLKPNDAVKVAYAAVLTAQAAVGTANENESKITYGDRKTTTWDKTETYTWKMDIFKYTLKDQEEQENVETPLAGAKFVLYRQTENGKLYVLADAQNRVTGWTADGVKPEAPEEGKAYATEFVTPASGALTISGLDSDVYYLEEIAAPAGYNLLAAPIRVTIDSEGKVTYGDKETPSEGTVRVLNRTGAELPSTGGIGTTVFYVAGAILVLTAGVLLVARRRMDSAA